MRFIHAAFITGLWGLLGLALALPGQDTPSMPMPVDEAHSALARWLQKPVLSRKLLDDMETTNRWSHAGPGAMTLCAERAHSGKYSLRLTSPTITDKPDTSSGRPFGAARAIRHFEGDNWESHNRICLWVYPTLPGFCVISLLITLRNEGAVKVPDRYNREGLNYVLLKPGQWNRVVWEIAHLARDKVTAIELTYRLQGNEPGSTHVVCFDFDGLELQNVEADPFEGWPVAAGRLAYSHTGYPSGSRKQALASNLKASLFELVKFPAANAQDPSQEFGAMALGSVKTVLRKDVQHTNTPLGTYQLLDFSEVDDPGVYQIEAGELKSRPFWIHPHAWERTLWKTLNFFYCERCGTEIVGIHDACHRDWMGTYNGLRMVINGGWHDAGDLSQGLVNTAEATYALFTLASDLAGRDAHPISLKETGGDRARSPTSIPASSSRTALLACGLFSEARWGLDWILKTRFGDGYRTTWATMDYWTDGIIGSPDDTFAGARNSPYENLVASATEARAARALRWAITHQPQWLDGSPALSTNSAANNHFAVLADRSLKAAEEDWKFALAKLEDPGLEPASAAAFAAVELYHATKDARYLDKAVEFARIICDCQERRLQDWPLPLTGFFYTNPKKQRLLHYSHRGHEQAPIVALSALCRLQPDHPDWMNWYATVVLHSEYYRRMTGLTQPYGMLPAGVYSLNDCGDQTCKEQVQKGIPLATHYYLKRFPVWGELRGHYGVLLSQTKALSQAARLRRNPELLNLCQQQLEWVIGRNPFAQSTMYGEGHDYAPQYTAMSGDMTGSLPVGIQTRANEDLPYWSTANCYNHKEVWVHPSSRWLWLMADLHGPAHLSGQVDPRRTSRLRLSQSWTGKSYEVQVRDSSGSFAATLPAGPYQLSTETGSMPLVLLPGEQHILNLKSPVALKQLKPQSLGENQVAVVVSVSGVGTHQLTLRPHNLEVAQPQQEVDLRPGQTRELQWKARIIRPQEPWIALVVPEEDPSGDACEILGWASE
jgi:hypothetical protein